MTRSDPRAMGAMLLVAMAGGCFVDIDVPLDAKISCTSDAECPKALVCVEDLGVCVHTDSPCVTDDGATVANGTECGDGLICVDGACATPFCGDGVVDFAIEQCDPGIDGSCRSTCVLPFCGDGIIDVGESCEGTPNCAGCSLDCSGDTGNCDLDAANGCECLPATVLAGTAANFFWSATIASGDLYVSLVDSEVALFEVWRVPLTDGAPAQLARGLEHAAVTSFDNLVYVTTTDAGNDSTVSRIDGDTLVPLYAQSNVQLGRLAADDEHIYVGADGIFIGDRETGDVAEQLTPVCGTSWLMQVCGADLLCYEDDTFILWAIDRESGEARGLDQGPTIRAGCSAEGKPLWHDFVNLYVEGADKTRQAIAQLPAGPTSNSFPNESIVILDGDPVVTLFAQGLPASYLVRRATRATQGVGAGFAIAAEGTSLAVFDLADETIKLFAR